MPEHIHLAAKIRAMPMRICRAVPARVDIRHPRAEDQLDSMLILQFARWYILQLHCEQFSGTSIFMWGSNRHGELGIGPQQRCLVPSPVHNRSVLKVYLTTVCRQLGGQLLSGHHRVVQICAGIDCSGALTSAGTVTPCQFLGHSGCDLGVDLGG